MVKKIVKIGLVDPEIFVKIKKLTQAKYTPQSAGLPSELNNCSTYKSVNHHI